MKFVGADLHKQSITFCVVEKVRGRIQLVTRKRLMCSRMGQIRQFLGSLGRFQVVVEATIGYDWFAALAEESAERVVIAHAGKLRIIAESTRKTDKIDAWILAEFLAHDMIPEAWRPTPRVRSHRSLVRRRQKIQSRITSIKNTIRGLLTRYNADRKDLFTQKGRKAIEKLKMLAEERWVLEDLREDLDQARARLKAVDRRLVEFAVKAPRKSGKRARCWRRCRGWARSRSKRSWRSWGIGNGFAVRTRWSPSPVWIRGSARAMVVGEI